MPAPRHGLLCALTLLAAPTAAGAQVDGRATPETRRLYANMRRYAAGHVMFGHQDTLAYGHDWRGPPDQSPDRSDVRDVAGDYPAVYGWDLGDLFARGRPGLADPAGADRLRGFVRRARARGGVNTFSWHMPNPVTGTDAWDVTPAVAAILPGGARHAAYVAQLDVLAAFFRSLADARGRPIPVWFRPFHEQTGDWFWWGRDHASPAEYAALWRFTVHHLRDVARVHNLLYAYSTDVFDDEGQYFRCYPGDRWVDLLGFDDYHSVATPATRPVLVRRLESVVRWARARGKLAALTEAGAEALPDARWWTGTLLPALDASADTRAISYVLVWRNANAAAEHREHYFAPFPGQRSAADFVNFRRSPLTAFERDLPDLYGRAGRWVSPSRPAPAPRTSAPPAAR